MSTTRAGQRSRKSKFGPRPYVLTAGRTMPSQDLQATTTVWAVEPGPGTEATALEGSLKALRAYLAQPRTVLETADYLELPIQVVKVLIADLVSAGLAATEPGVDQRSDIELLARVLHAVAAPA